MKYIMYEVITPAELAGQKIPFIFPSNFVHQLMATGLRAALALHNIRVVPVSAGEISIYGTDIVCQGKSDTLHLEADPTDALVIHNYDYTQGLGISYTDELLRKLKEQK
jgi:hypothetical protein